MEICLVFQLNSAKTFITKIPEVEKLRQEEMLLAQYWKQTGIFQNAERLPTFRNSGETYEDRINPFLFIVR